MRSVPVLLGFTDGDVWRPGIGDPTPMGWFTVLAYFAVAWICVRKCLVAAKDSAPASERIFWAVLSLLLITLGINKQLDLQTFLTLFARKLALAQGWYEQRRLLQALFVGFVALAGILGCLFMWRMVRDNRRKLRLTFLGTALLLSFVVIRAASFHHLDQLINSRLAGIRMNWLLELGAITVIAFGAAAANDRRPTPHQRSSTGGRAEAVS